MSTTMVLSYTSALIVLSKRIAVRTKIFMTSASEMAEYNFLVRIRVARMHLSVAIGFDRQPAEATQAVFCQYVLNVWDTKVQAFLREIELKKYLVLMVLIGADMEDFMNRARNSAGEQDPTPQHVNATLKAWNAPLLVWRKVAQCLVLHEMHPPDSASDGPSSQEHSEDVVPV
ncbi:hypothetical protein BDR03DRAFT_979776 [Suillus americanus]|nr:hypothetical protein BDR03DRAFT_979776 [Suillus americanus]